MLVFEERGKPEYPEKNPLEQRRESTTNSTHIWRRHGDLNPGHTGGRWALSPLRHPLLRESVHYVIHIAPSQSICTGCRNVNHCQQQQSYLGLRSPGRSYSTYWSNFFVWQIERPPEGFKYGTIEGSYMADYFKNSNNTYFRQIWRHMQNNNVKKLVDGVNAVSNG